MKPSFDGGISGPLPPAAELAPKPDGVDSFRMKGRFAIHLYVVCVSIHDTLVQLLEMSGTEIQIVTSGDRVRWDRW